MSRAFMTLELQLEVTDGSGPLDDLVRDLKPLVGILRPPDRVRTTNEGVEEGRGSPRSRAISPRDG